MNIKKVLFVLFIIISSISLYAEEESIPELFKDSYSLEELGKYNESINKTLKVIRMNPKLYIANLRAGWLFYLQGNYSDSEKYYRSSIDLSTDAVEPLLGLSLPLMAAKNYTEAINVCKKIIKIDKGSYIGNSRLAYILYLTEDFKNSLKYYKILLALYPSDPEIKLGIAYNLIKLNDFEGARDYFKSILLSNPDHPSATSGLNSIKTTTYIPAFSMNYEVK